MIYSIAIGYTLALSYGAVAARRYHQYMRQKRRAVVDKNILAFLIALTFIAVKLLEAAGVTKKRQIEHVEVE